MKKTFTPEPLAVFASKECSMNYRVKLGLVLLGCLVLNSPVGVAAAENRRAKKSKTPLIYLNQSK